MRDKHWKVAGLFLLGRLILLSTQPAEGLRGFGDFIHYFQLNTLGIPFIDFWSEYPPLFPFLSWLIFRVTAGQQHTYEYILLMFLSLAQAGSIWIFIRLVTDFQTTEVAWRRIWVYVLILSTLPYGWWYFDSIVVFKMLLGLSWLLGRKVVRSGFGLALGILAKLFPAMLFPLVLRRLPRRQAVIVITLTLGIVLFVYAGFYLNSPGITMASLRSQASKGTWGTLWALIDGNLRTGNFGPEIERLNPESAARPMGNPPKMPAWATLIVFAAIGIWIWFRTDLSNSIKATAFLGVTWCLFLFWTPGYSPQWVLYLIPLILLVLPDEKAFTMAFALIFINILEWPILLSRGYNWGLWFTIPIRMLLVGLLFVEFYRLTRPDIRHHLELEDNWKPTGHL